MRNLSETIRHCQTLCWVWRVRLNDQTELGFTDHDRPLAFEGIVCEPRSGFTPGEADTRQGFSIDNVAVQGILDSEYLTAEDVRAGRFERAEIDCFRVNWQDPSDYAHISQGYIGDIRQVGHLFEVEWVGAMSRLERSTGRVFSRMCDAEFGDHRCRLHLADFPNGTTCPRTFRACHEQFSNAVNFRGFPYLIGDDAMTSGIREGEPRDGGSRYA